MNNIEGSYPGGVSAGPEALRQYFDDGTIDNYERVLSEGKEAVVHVVSKKEGAVKRYYAAKVYKTREERGFKNRADYFVTQGLSGKRRELRAVRKKTRFGREVEEFLWQNRETVYLEKLLAAGADVPVLVKAGRGGRRGQTLLGSVVGWLGISNLFNILVPYPGTGIFEKYYKDYDRPDTDWTDWAALLHRRPYPVRHTEVSFAVQEAGVWGGTLLYYLDPVLLLRIVLSGLAAPRAR